MSWRRFTHLGAAVCFAMISVLFCAPADAQRTSPKFKKGDSVEVREGFKWVRGTVMGFEATGWVDVKLDKSDEDSADDNAGGFHSSFHHMTWTQPYPPDDVRPGKSQKPAAPVRTWTDRSGKFSVRARFQGTKDNRVVLQRSDGKTVLVPIEKLSDDDANYVKGILQPTENPFRDGAASGDAGAAPAPTKKPNWHEARQVQPKTFTKWTFTPTDAGRGQLLQLAGAANAEVPLHEIDSSNKFFETVEGIYASRDGGHVFLCRKEGRVIPPQQEFLELIDLGKKQSLGLVPLPDSTRVLDVDPDDGLVMYIPDSFNFGDKSLLTIARFDGKQLTTVTRWEPYVHEDWPPRRDMDNGWFLGGKRAMTINHQGSALTVWDFDACKALLNVPVKSSIGLTIALSPDRKLLAIVMKDGVAIIDLAAGRHVATIPTKGQKISRVEFRGDNARLAAMSSQGVTVWDLTSGQPAAEFFSDVLNDQSPLTWAGEYLLVHNRFLFDVNRRVILWEYQNSSGFGTFAAERDGRIYFVPKPARDAETTLVSARLPNVGALEEAKKLPSAKDLLVVKPGDPVAIEVDIDPSIQLTDEVKRALTANLPDTGGGDAKDSNIVVLKPGGAQVDLIRRALAAGLEKSGLKVVDHSDLVVKAVCKPQPQQIIRINIDGRFPPRPRDIVERSITPHASYLEMKLGDTVLWKRGFVAQPNMVIYPRQGENLDQALQRLTRPDISLFTNVKFSPYVARPGKATDSGAYGVSRMTTRGMIDGESSTGRGNAFE